MAVSIEQWFCEELSKLGIDATEENAEYILSMKDAEDLQEYMLSLLDGSDPAVRAFLPRLMERWYAIGGKPPPNAKAYRKSEETEVYVQAKTKKKRERNKNKESNGSAAQVAAASASASASMETTSTAADSKGVTMSSVSSSIVNGAESQEQLNGVVADGQFLGQGARKKSKFVPLYSQHGKEKLVIKLPGRIQCMCLTLKQTKGCTSGGGTFFRECTSGGVMYPVFTHMPGRTQCECQALKHKLINNCTSCGRVVCEQEGAGPCLFCGKLVCSPEDQEVLSRGSKKSEKLYQHLMRDVDKLTPLCRGGGERQLLPSVSARMQEGLQKAQKHKDLLIEFDKTSVRRTQVIDDECDYFSTDSNQWLSKEDRDALRKREEELRAARHGSRRDRKVTLDFAGRRVVEESNTVGQTMYDHQDAVVQQVQYRPHRGDHPESGEQGFLVNPSIVQPAPQFVADRKTKTTSEKSSGKSSKAPEDAKAKLKMPVIQDRELKEMSDEGMCLSMHQPWASLLVAGIKIHEGRSWYTVHRGRLWIAATAKAATTEEITELENHYRSFYKDPHLDFPSDYPAGCLLGCVDLADCLSQEDYRQKYPDGESSSPYVFICENPQELIIKFPIKGKHKIYKLDSQIHQGAKKGLR